jgi:hypothetical protein
VAVGGAATEPNHAAAEWGATLNAGGKLEQSSNNKKWERLVNHPPLRAFLVVETLAFAAAALVHFGAVLHGYEHHDARIAESVIALVLLGGLALSVLRPRLLREAALGAQGFALLGTCVGLFTIAVGVGPRTVLDVVYHFSVVAVLIWGLFAATRLPSSAP